MVYPICIIALVAIIGVNVVRHDLRGVIMSLVGFGIGLALARFTRRKS